MSKKVHWIVPESLIDQDPKLQNGEEFQPAMVGAYYGSSLEYNLVCTPQYVNAQDLVCPMDDTLKAVFKPKRPFGTFGSLVSDQDQSEYRYEAGRAVIELTSEEDIRRVADSLEGAMMFPSLRTGNTKLEYRAKDGRTWTYEEAIQEMSSYRAHNQAVQAKIDELVKERGYAPTYVNGKWDQKKYPDDLVNSIAELAKTKKSITGFNLKVQLVGRHTIALKRNYYKSSISDDELLDLADKCNYKVNKSSTFKTGVIRLGTIIIPVQNIPQLTYIKSVLGKSADLFAAKWSEAVKKSKISLVRESYESQS